MAIESLSQTDLGAVLGISTRAIRKLHRGPDGIPHHREGAEVRYPLPSAVQWYFREKYGGDEAADAKSRLLNAEATLREAKVARGRGEWVHIDDLETLHSKPLAELRARLLALPGRIAAELPLPAAEALDVIEPIVHEFMSELSEDGGDGAS